MSQKILLVESEPALSALWSQALESRGFAVETLADAVRCVEQVHQQRPDLVVLSVELSGGQNGYLVCGKLKKEDALRDIPVVIVGNPDGFAAHRKLKAHADEYLAKPVDTDELVERVVMLLGDSGTSAPELPDSEPEAVLTLHASESEDSAPRASPAASTPEPSEPRAPRTRVTEFQKRPAPTPPERKSSSALWLLIALAALAGGGWMIYAGLAREAPAASNVQP